MDTGFVNGKTEAAAAAVLAEDAGAERKKPAPLLLASIYVAVLFAAAFFGIRLLWGGAGLRSLREDDEAQARIEKGLEAAEAYNRENSDIRVVEDPAEETEEEEESLPPALMLTDMSELYEKNNDVIGWLKIDDTVIDYAVMQTLDDEEYYLYRDINGNQSTAGSLIMDTDSHVGTGTLAAEYRDGSAPSTNLIIHGHNMKNGSMFGSLDNWRKESYEREHNIIEFSSLYEKRKYEIVSVFLSQVYLVSQTDVFKYYKFFQANTEEEFNDFYDNIKKLALYDTGVTAEYGDEFITLSVCAYHVTNGRLVIVGKRIE